MVKAYKSISRLKSVKLLTALGIMLAQSSSPLTADCQAEVKQASKQNQASDEIQLFLPPVMSKGSDAWGSAYSENGQGISHLQMSVNGKKIETDDYGLFHFDAPDTAFSITIQKDGKTLIEKPYVMSNRGLLTSDKSLAEKVDALDELEDDFVELPTISHAPSVVEPLQAFTVIGRNFTGKFGYDQLNIDGYECDTFAGSDRSIVAAAKVRSGIGPLKEMNVVSKQLSSLPVEIDLAKVVVRSLTKSEDKLAADLDLVGTNLPSIVALSTAKADTQLRFAGKRLGAQSIFLSPGGKLNRIAISSNQSNTEDLSAHLLANSLVDPYTLRTTDELIGKRTIIAADKAEIVRLKRRLLAAEERILLLSKQRTQEHQQSNDKFNAEDDSKLESSIRAASVRLARLSRSFQARKAILNTEGLSDTEWAQLNDSAADGAHSIDTLITKEFGFTESRLLRSSPAKKKTQADQLAQLSSTVPTANSPLGKSIYARGRKWRAPAGGSAEGGRLVAPPAPYKFNPADLAPYFTEEMPSPVPALKSKATKQRRLHSQSRNRDSAKKAPSIHTAGRAKANNRKSRNK